MNSTQNNFSGLGIARIFKYERLKFHSNPIQHKVIPIAIEGKDIIGVAQTVQVRLLLLVFQ